MSKASSLSGNITSAARLALAISSEASSTVRLGSCPITDMTILIITCRRRIFLASSQVSCSAPSCSPRFGFSITSLDRELQRAASPPHQPPCPARRSGARHPRSPILPALVPDCNRSKCVVPADTKRPYLPPAAQGTHQSSVGGVTIVSAPSPGIATLARSDASGGVYDRQLTPPN